MEHEIMPSLKQSVSLIYSSMAETFMRRAKFELAIPPIHVSVPGQSPCFAKFEAKNQQVVDFNLKLPFSLRLTTDT